MKFSKFNFGLLALFFLMLTACSKSEDDNNSAPAAVVPGELVATVGQDNFATSNATARYRSTGELTISASTTDAKSFFFVIDGFVGTSDYSFDSNVGNSAQYSYTFNGNPQRFSTDNGGSGVLTVTSYDETKNEISGVFTFTALQVNNPGTSIEVTEGSFTNVPITEIQEPAAGTMAYYADDVFYETSNVTIETSPSFRINFTLPAAQGNLQLNLNSPDSTFDAVEVSAHSGSDYYTNFSVSDFSFVDNKLNVKLKSLDDRDIELWINDYPVTPYVIGEPGTLTFYTDTATFTSIEVMTDQYVDNNNEQVTHFAAVNSNGSVVDFRIAESFAIFVISSDGEYAVMEGVGEIHFNESGTSVTYVSFLANNESIVMEGRDIPL